MNFFDLVNGKIGKIIEGMVCENLDNFGKKIKWNGEDFFCGDDDWVVVEGKKYIIGEEVCEVDEMDVSDKDEVVLFREDGYRGRVCYAGCVKKNGKWFWMDIVGEGIVYKLEFFEKDDIE